VDYRIIVGNNPVNWVDPSGLIIGSIVARILGGVGFLSESMPVAGLIADTVVGAGLAIVGVDEIDPCLSSKLGFAYGFMEGWGGIAGITNQSIIV